MNENLSTESDYKQTFKSAIDKYSMQIMMHGLIAFILFFLTYYATAFLLLESKLVIIEYLGVDISSEDCASRLRQYLIAPVALVAGILAIVYLNKQVKRTRRKTDLHCPKCQTSLVKWKIQNQVTQTGICPACLKKLFEGKLVSEQAAIEFHQKTKKEMNHLVRFSGWGSLAGVLIAIPTLLWGRNSSILLGKNPISNLELIAVVSVLFLMLPVSFWVISKSSVSESQQFIKLFREYSNQSDTINQKHAQREPEA